MTPDGLADGFCGIGAGLRLQLPGKTHRDLITVIF